MLKEIEEKSVRTTIMIVGDYKEYIADRFDELVKDPLAPKGISRKLKAYRDLKGSLDKLPFFIGHLIGTNLTGDEIAFIRNFKGLMVLDK
jgi:hypothetical protein